MTIAESLPIFVEIENNKILIGTMLIDSSYHHHPEDDTTSKLSKIKRIKIIYKKREEIYFNTKDNSEEVKSAP